MKKQVLAIHGGDTFETYEEYLDFLRAYRIDLASLSGKKRWRDDLPETLGEEYEVICPSMPSKYNARYIEWKIWFEKHVPHLRDGVTLIGHSLGGIFLAKYLSENKLSVQVAATFLVSAPYSVGGTSGSALYSLVDFILPDSLALLESQGGKIFLIHSEDDTVVDYKDVEEYARKLPHAEKMIFTDRDHFAQQEFPEIIEAIRAVT